MCVQSACPNPSDTHIGKENIVEQNVCQTTRDSYSLVSFWGCRRSEALVYETKFGLCRISTESEFDIRHCLYRRTILCYCGLLATGDIDTDQ